MIRRLYHLTSLNLAVDAIKHDMLESAYDRSARDMALQGMDSDAIRALLEETFHEKNYIKTKGIPFFAWFEDHYLIFGCNSSPQQDNKYIHDEVMRDYLVRFTVDVDGLLERFEYHTFRPTVLSMTEEEKDDPLADRSYIGVPSLSLDDVVHIHASPRAQGALRAAVMRYGSEHLRSVPIDIIHYKRGILFDVKVSSS